MKKHYGLISRTILIISFIIFIVLLIKYAEDISSEIAIAINRCLTIVIPSLYCFIVLSNLVIKTNLFYHISKPFIFISRYIFRIKPQFFSIFLLSQVMGYPCGANLIINMYDKGDITKIESESMLCYCYNSSASFIIGLVGINLYSSAKTGLLIYLSIIITNLLLAIIMNIRKPLPEKETVSSPDIQFNTNIFIESIQNASKSMCLICAMIIIFSVIIVFINKTGIINLIGNIIVGVLNVKAGDVTNSLNSLVEVSAIVNLSSGTYSLIPIIAAIFSFGGICIIFQIISLVRNKFSIKKLVLSRIFSMPIAYCICRTIFYFSNQSVTTIILQKRYNLFSNISPIPSIFLLIMTILLLSKKSMVNS